MKYVRHILLIVLSVLTALCILSAYTNYEFMTDEYDEGLFCAVPLYDSTAPFYFYTSKPWLYSFLYLIPMLIIASIGSVVAIRRRADLPPSLGYALLLVMFWGWRFFVSYPKCPGW